MFNSLFFNKKVIDTIRSSVVLFITGALAGAAATIFDLYVVEDGQVFSRLSLWICICTAAAVTSSAPDIAGLRVFSFYAGVVPAYFMISVLNGHGWTNSFAISLAVFSAVSPIFAYVLWHSRENKVFADILPVAAAIATLLISDLMFGINGWDAALCVVLIYVCYKNKDA